MAKVKKALRREKGSGGVYKARGYYYLQYTPETGKRKAVTLRNLAGEKITDFREADAAAAEFLQKEKALQTIESREQYLHEVAKVKQLRAKLTITIGEAFELAIGKPNALAIAPIWLARKRGHWVDFQRFLEDNFRIITLDEVTPEMTEKYISYLQSKGYWQREKKRKNCLNDPDDPDSQVLSPKTINLVMINCRWVFKQLSRDLGYREDDNPFYGIIKLREDPVQREVFTDGDLRNIFLNPPPLMEGLFTIGLCTGLREGDVATLRWREIFTYNEDTNGKPNFYEAEIERRTSKTKVTVSIPVERELANYLSKQWEISGDQEYVLPEAAKLHREERLSYQIIKYLQSIGIKTKIEVPGRKRQQSVKDFHSLRHSFCYYAGLRGVPLPIVQSIVGHMNPKMTMYYQKHADRKAKQEGLSMMNGLLISSSFGDIKQIAGPQHELRQELHNVIDSASEGKLLAVREFLKSCVL